MKASLKRCDLTVSWSGILRLCICLVVAACVNVGLGAATTLVRTPAEISQTLKDAQPGDEIIIGNGVYKDLKLLLSTDGGSTLPLRVKCESAGGVVLTGQTEIRITGRYIELIGLTMSDCKRSSGSKGLILLSGANHCRVTSCTFQRTSFETLPLVGIRDASSDNRIDHCLFSDVRFRSITVTVDKSALKNGPPMRNRIDHNVFMNVPPRGKNGGETIQVGQLAMPHSDLRPETIIENNLFVRCDGEAEIISLKTSGNIVRNNQFRECQGSIVLRHGHENIIENNHISGGLGGVRVHGHGHRVVGNSITGCSEIGIQLTYGTTDTLHPASYLPVYDCTIADNIISDCTEAGVYIGTRRNAVYRNEIWSGSPWFSRNTMRCTIAPYRNVVENNIISGSSGKLLRSARSPNNEISDNVLRVSELPVWSKED